MGRGNWFPGSSLEDSRLVYVDYSDDSIEPDDDDLRQFNYQDFKACLFSCLPKSFVQLEDCRGLPQNLRIQDRDSVPLAYNSLFTLWIDAQGDDYHCGVGFTVNEDAPCFARSRLDETAKLVFDKLADCYPLSVRRCAWTSGPYQKAVPA